MLEDRRAVVFSMGLTTDVDVSADCSIGEDACDICVEVKVVVDVVDDTVVVAASVEDPHITLRFPFNPPGIQISAHHDSDILFRTCCLLSFFNFNTNK